MPNRSELPAPDWLHPDWPAPPAVRAVSTTRMGGASRAPFDSLNLGDHVGDDPDAVAENRARLRNLAGMPVEPLWLRQVHSARAVSAEASPGSPEADACVATGGAVCVVMTADCLPVLFCDRSASRVAAAHAGWRGLHGGVLEATVAMLGPPDGLMAWLGPAIGPESFEVGPEVRAAFLDAAAEDASAFRPSTGDRWLADIYTLARSRLRRAGVEAVYGGGFDTFRDARRFFSYRRDGRTGRMASAIWLQDA